MTWVGSSSSSNGFVPEYRGGADEIDVDDDDGEEVEEEEEGGVLLVDVGDVVISGGHSIYVKNLGR